jgi:hypothetical protein
MSENFQRDLTDIVREEAEWHGPSVDDQVDEAAMRAWEANPCGPPAKDSTGTAWDPFAPEPAE